MKATTAVPGWSVSFGRILRAIRELPDTKLIEAYKDVSLMYGLALCDRDDAAVKMLLDLLTALALENERRHRARHRKLVPLRKLAGIPTAAEYREGMRTLAAHRTPKARVVIPRPFVRSRGPRSPRDRAVRTCARSNAPPDDPELPKPPPWTARRYGRRPL